jgi:Na+-transporting methylmalonyl-CoA/oxaloacetate decarboxylase gamma subunit
MTSAPAVLAILIVLAIAGIGAIIATFFDAPVEEISE